MTKNSKKEYVSGMTNLANLLALIAVCLAATAVLLPFWLQFPAQPTLSWSYRNVGLIQVSGQFTNMQLTWADQSWSDVAGSVCSVANAEGGTMSSSLTSKATSAVLNIAGASCGAACQVNFFTRCQKYKLMTILGYLAAFTLLGGACVCALAAAMPYVAKESGKDKVTISYVMILGSVIAAIGPAVWVVVWMSAMTAIRATSWYPDYSFGVSFYVGACAVGMCIFSTFPQFAKVVRARADKKKAKDLLVETVDPAFLLDPALL